MAPALINESIEPYTPSEFEFDLGHFDSTREASPDERGLSHPTNTHVHCLTKPEKEELRVALENFKRLGLDGPDVNQKSFPLPSLGPLLHKLSVALHGKLGYFVLRGHDSSQLNPEDSLITFLGVSSYIGTKRGSQDERGSMIKHVKQASSSSVPQEDRPSKYSTVQLPFHTDSCCDVIAMQVRSCPAKGGRQLVASMYDVYYEIARENPGIIRILSREDWYTTAYKTIAPPRPILFIHDDQAVFQFHPSQMTRAVAHIKPTGEQFKALQVVELAAQKHQVALPMQTGDMTFINNFSTLHSRESFEDSGDQYRHLVRLWLKNERLANPIPEPLKATNEEIYSIASEDERWQVRPIDKLFFKPPERLGSPA